MGLHYFLISPVNHIVIAMIFLSGFIKLKNSLLAISTVIIYMFYECYCSNPLRVTLMFFPHTIGYAVVIIRSIIKNSKKN